VRIRAKRGHQIAAVAVARKLTALCWHLLTRGEDYLWARPALIANKSRAMNIKALRDQEMAIAVQAQRSYERLVAHWQPRRPKQPARGRLSSAAHQ
jgi:transposase